VSKAVLNFRNLPIILNGFVHQLGIPESEVADVSEREPLAIRRLTRSRENLCINSWWKMP